MNIAQLLKTCLALFCSTQVIFRQDNHRREQIDYVIEKKKKNEENSEQVSDSF